MISSVDIQGHDSIEDAFITLELALFKAAGHDALPLPWTTPNCVLEKHTIFHEAALRLNFCDINAAVCSQQYNASYICQISRIFLNCAGPCSAHPKWKQHALGYR